VCAAEFEDEIVLLPFAEDDKLGLVLHVRFCNGFDGALKVRQIETLS